MNISPPRASRLSFTLIELLVVVAIIAILASLLLPSLSAARKKAKLSACTSNLRQVSMLLSMYASDNDGYLAGTTFGNRPNRTCLTWYDPDATHWSDAWVATNPYIEPSEWKGAGQAFYCPSAPLSATWADTESTVTGGVLTYIMVNNEMKYTWYDDNPTLGPSRCSGGKLDSFDPRSTLLQDWVFEPTASSNRPNLYRTSHDGGGNVLFVDGAVDWHAASEMEVEVNANGVDSNRVYVLHPMAKMW